MRALVLDNDGLRFDPHRPAPDSQPGEALVRVTRAGICNTDIELTKGYMGFRGVLGHEFVGVVESLIPARQDDERIADAGDRVVGEINAVPLASPARTWFERAQDPTRTTVGIDRRDGAFADLVRVPVANLHRVPVGVTDDEAVFVEPLAAACAILEQVHVRPTDRVRVIGDGKLGLLCAMVLATVPCDLLVIGKHQSKLDILRNVGIRVRAIGGASDPDQSPRDADVVVECTGSALGFESARRMLRPRGTLVLKSTYEGLLECNMTMVVVDEITVIGSRCGPFAAALRLLETKRVNVAPLIHARFPLEDGARAFDKASEKGVLKVLLDVA